MAKATYYEMPAKDPDKIKKFYTKVLGWKYKKWGKDKYWMIEGDKKEEGIDGGIYLSEKMRGVVPTFSVKDLNQAVKKAKDAGGKIFMTTDEENHFYIRDPEGTIFGIWQS